MELWMFKDSHRYANPTDMSMGIIRHLPKKEKRKMERKKEKKRREKERKISRHQERKKYGRKEK